MSPYKFECTTCSAPVGRPCRERYCKNGYRDCEYAICARWRELETPHIARRALAEAAS